MSIIIFEEVKSKKCKSEGGYSNKYRIGGGGGEIYIQQQYNDFPVKTTCSKFTGEDHHCLVATTERRLWTPLCCTVNSIKSEHNPLYISTTEERSIFYRSPDI